jgi:hypothetical protein
MYIGKCSVLKSRIVLRLKVCLHEQCFLVSDATAASDTAQKIGLFLSLDAAVASNTEKHYSSKQTFSITVHAERF